MALKYDHIFHFKALQMFPLIGIFGLNINHLATLSVTKYALGKFSKSFIAHLERGDEGVGDELGPDVVLGKQVVGTEVLHEAGEALVQP
jgi:hypothetical protein